MASRNGAGDAWTTVGGRLAVGVSLLTGACGQVRSDVGENRALDDGGAGSSGSGGRSVSAGGAVGQGGAFAAGGSVIVQPPPPEATCGIADAGPAAGVLAPYVVSNARVARRTLYSWTNAAQLDELRADPTLLTRSASADGQRGRAADLIASMVSYVPLAAVLDGPDFARKRFGWPHAWPTALGWEGETYGDQLLEIRLRESAWVVRFRAYDQLLEVFDMNDRPVPIEAALADPGRIAAILFIDETAVEACGNTFGASTFREYVLCNERMIEGWSALTPEIREHLEQSVAALSLVRDALAVAGCVEAVGSVDCFARDAVGAWQDPQPDLVGEYLASLALPNGLYQPTTGNLDALLSQLRARLFEPAPLRHTSPGDAAP